MAPDPTVKKCEEGYTLVFDMLCVEKTTLKTLDDILPDLPDMPDLENLSCEMALNALNQTVKTLEQTLALPRKLIQQCNRLLNKPFGIAGRLVRDALSVFDGVTKMIDDLIAGVGVISELRKALESALQCPVIAASPVGEMIEKILDLMDKGGDYRTLLNQLKNAMLGQANDFLNELKKTPAEALRKAQQMMDDMLERAQIPELIKLLKAIEKCVQAACDMARVAKRIYNNSDNILDSIKATYDEATGKVKSVVLTPVTATEKAAAETVEMLDGWYKAAAFPKVEP